jgi:prepilin-type N-terminal cleavage/methylation domain-containing protein/prepilin-type processing-associated H-X9-DG protein
MVTNLKILRSMQVKKRAFTLIELLTVMTIIAILGGMLFPVFARAREKARQTACISSERQLGLAFAQYSQDYDERIPSGTIGLLGRGWAGQTYPYVKSSDIYKCPDDSVDKDDGDPNLMISFAMNSNAAGISQADFVSPSLTALCFEVNDSFADVKVAETTSPTGRGLPKDNCPWCGKPFGADYYATGNLGGVAPPLSTTIRPYHDPTSNYLAADGHVKALRGEVVSPGENAPSSDFPQSIKGKTATGTSSMMIVPNLRAALTFSTR